MLISWFIGAWLVVMVIWLCGCGAASPCRKTLQALADSQSPRAAIDPTPIQDEPANSVPASRESFKSEEIRDELDELEEISRWTAFSVQSFRVGLLDEEQLVRTITCMAERIEAIRKEQAA